jgi:hypothetical protein
MRISNKEYRLTNVEVVLEGERAQCYDQDNLKRNHSEMHITAEPQWRRGTLSHPAK